MKNLRFRKWLHSSHISHICFPCQGKIFLRSLLKKYEKLYKKICSYNEFSDLSDHKIRKTNGQTNIALSQMVYSIKNHSQNALHTLNQQCQGENCRLLQENFVHPLITIFSKYVFSLFEVPGMNRVLLTDYFQSQVWYLDLIHKHVYNTQSFYFDFQR